MDIKGDVLLKYSGWSEIDKFLDLKSQTGPGFFTRTVDLFILACAIGIQADKGIENDSDKEYNTIGRNTYITNDDVSRIFSFMFENAILSSKRVNFDINTRMKLAFDSDFNMDKFSPINFLVEFSNYGIDILNGLVKNSDVTSIESITNYLKNLVCPDYKALEEEMAKTLEQTYIDNL